MEKSVIEDLIDRYLNVSIQVHKKAGTLIKVQIGNEMTTDQYFILRYIFLGGKSTSSELADAFDVNKSAITAIINRMEDRRLIDRTRDLTDRRVVYLSLTEEGKELYQKAQDKVGELVASIITQFDETEITSFINTYEKLEKILDNRKREEWRD